MYNDADSWIDTIIADRYHCISVLGDGAMARVYLAIDLVHQSQVALKRLRVRDLNARFLTRYWFNSHQISTFHHTCHVPLRDYFINDDEPVIVTDLVSGKSLFSVIEQCSRLQIGEVQSLLFQFAKYLAALHRHGLMHLDCTPKNIFINPDRSIAITDAGLARVITDTGLTLTGFVMEHSLQFLAPEQGMYDVVTPATDIYQCGVLMYRLLTGAYPRPAATVQEYMQIYANASQSQQDWHPGHIVANIPPSIDNLVNRCLSIDPQRRPANGSLLLAVIMNDSDFDEYQTIYKKVEPSIARPPQMKTKNRKRFFRHFFGVPHRTDIANRYHGKDI